MTPPMTLPRVDLPAPFAPTSACTVPAVDLDADVVEGLGAGVALADRDEPDLRDGRLSSGPSFILPKLRRPA